MEYFSEWLLRTLKVEDILPDDAGIHDVLDLDMLIMDTDLEEADIENLRAAYKEHCESNGLEPDFDI